MAYNPDELVNLKEPNEQDSGESVAEESAESPEKEASEQGTSADVSEEFQKQCNTTLMSATKPELEYLLTKVQAKISKMNKAETKPEKSGTFDTEGMPE